MPGPEPDSALVLSATLGMFEEHCLQMKCTPPGCGASSYHPLRLLVRRFGPGIRFGDLVPRIVCKECRKRPGEVALLEHITTDGKGRHLGWRVDLSSLIEK